MYVANQIAVLFGCNSRRQEKGVMNQRIASQFTKLICCLVLAAAWWFSWCALLPSGTRKLERERRNQGMIKGIRTARPRCPPALDFCDDRSGKGCDETD
jgi:hypothetical protein